MMVKGTNEKNGCLFLRRLLNIQFLKMENYSITADLPKTKWNPGPEGKRA